MGQEKETDEAVPAWLTSETASDEEESFDFESEEDDFFDSDKASEAQLFEEDEGEPAAEDWLRDTDEQDDEGIHGFLPVECQRLSQLNATNEQP